MPWAEALAMDGDTFVAVGTNKEVKAFAAGKDFEEIDLEGKTVLPGLIDGHTHPSVMADSGHGCWYNSQALDAFRSCGIIGYMDGATVNEGEMQYLYQLDKEDRLNLYYEGASLLSKISLIEEAIAQARDWQAKYHTDHINCRIIKFFGDGALLRFLSLEKSVMKKCTIIFQC